MVWVYAPQNPQERKGLAPMKTGERSFDISCKDCEKTRLGFDGNGPAYAYGDHYKCKECRDFYEKSTRLHLD